MILKIWKEKAQSIRKFSFLLNILLTTFFSRVNIGNLVESQHGYKPKIGSLVPEPLKKVHHSVDLDHDPYIHNSAEHNEGNHQKIEYEEAKHEDILNIDDEVKSLEEIQEGVSDDEESERNGLTRYPQSDFMNINSDEITQQQNTDENSLDEKAQTIVDQMKELLIKQLKKNLRNESNAHYGIKWNECQVEPIVGTRYKCAICIEYNLCEYCEVNNEHNHIFIKIKDRNARVPMLCEIKHMVQKLPKQENEKLEIRQNLNYPNLALDISWAFGIIGNPAKSCKNIQKALLVSLHDKEFLKTIQIDEIDGEDGINKDLLISVSWKLLNKTQEEWPSNPDKVVLKCLSNDYLIKLKDLRVTEDQLTPIKILPEKTSILKIIFVLPNKIRQATIKDKKTLNLLFSLYDEEINQYIGSNLPCTIPL